ncbi:MAG: DUF697 domain-containing protein [Cyanobacteria bacterium P01_F01_bin.53]
MKLKRPILVGGLGLSASLWLLNIVGHSPVGHAFGDGSMLIGAIGVGAGLWWMNKLNGAGSVVVEPPLALGPLHKSAIEHVIASIETTLETLIEELPEDTKLDKTAEKNQAIWAKIEAQREVIAQLLTNLDRETLSLAVVGNKATGKTALISQLEKSWQAKHSNVTAITEIEGEEATPPIDADLVLFVTAADLTQSELQRIHTLLKDGYRVQLAYNKQDQLTPIDRQSVVQRIQTRIEDLGIDVRAIAAQPNPITVRKHQEDGTVEEFSEQPEPQLSSLTERLTHLVENDAEQLVLTTTLRQAKALLTSTQTLLDAQRRERAMPIVEQMQWIAAGSAFASPLPSLDLLASTAINAQMIVDLGAVYGQSFSLEQAKTAAGTLAELLVKLGLVELSTQAFGSLLKTHFATYVAGGALQGVSAAYLTYMVGVSLIDFFEEQSFLAPEKQKFAFSEMGERLQAIFKTTKQGLGLQAFVQQALTHLPALPQAKPAAAQ